MDLLMVAVMDMGIRMVYTMLTANEQRVKSHFLQNQLMPGWWGVEFINSDCDAAENSQGTANGTDSTIISNLKKNNVKESMYHDKQNLFQEHR
jgi:hypothetical protein